MARLDLLPDDIKFIIIRYLDGMRSLRALCIAASSYTSIYKRYASTLDRHLHFTDSLKYQRESMWIVVYFKLTCQYRPYMRQRDALIAVEDYYLRPVRKGPEDVRRLSLFYSRSYTKMVVDGFENYEEADKDKISDVLFENHKAIYYVYDTFVREQLSSRNSASQARKAFQSAVTLHRKKHLLAAMDLPSTDEEQRIIRAIYRFWMLLLVADIPDSRPFYVHEPVQTKLFACWGFWETLAVVTVKNFLMRKITNALRPIDDEERRVFNSKLEGPHAAFYQRYLYPLIVGVVMQKDFPKGMSSWLSEQAQRGQNPDKMSFVQRDFYHPYKYFPNWESYRLRPSGLLFLVLDGHMARCLKRFNDPTPPIIADGPLRPFRPGRAVKLQNPSTSPAAGLPGVNSRDMDDNPKDNPVDSEACVWDDWRLEYWGYGFPYDPDPSLDE